MGVERPAAARIAKRRGAIHRRASLAAAAGADLVVLATPVLTITRLLGRLAAGLGPKTVVTDVGSTKLAILRAARAGLPPGRFIGGHPLAGCERSGILAASPELFRGAPWALVAPPGSHAALLRVAALVRAVGAQPKLCSAQRHDRAVALVSHLPQLAASGLMALALAGRALDFAGPGLHDTTRLAASRFPVWGDILATNHREVTRAADALSLELRRMARSRSYARRVFDAARRGRERLLQRRRAPAPAPGAARRRSRRP